jgi:lipopolysaccharide/colanic/teichoic acid biosynthesis glycosyltransferase
LLGTGNLGTVAEGAVRRDTARALGAADAMAGVAQPKRGATYRRIVKPVADRTLGGLLLLVMAPLFIVVAALIRLTLGPGVLYRQRRVGKDNRVFTMYKFRTMAPDQRLGEKRYHGDDRRVTHKCDEDPRHTRLGRTLRKWSLDELPQLWNVVVGEMSLVGPRPELAEVVMRHDLWDHPRNLVKPGITGLWQISPDRGRRLHESLEYDVAYLSDLRFGTDVKILFATPRAVLQRQGR